LRFRAAWWPRLALVLLIAIPLILAVSPSGGTSTASPDAAILSRGSQVHGGPPPDLVILYAGEVMGWTEPCG
jgi:hypothetical protein